ncbi:MAG: zinc ribbon domain-containing protein [Rubrobacteraceae bacterium]
MCAECGRRMQTMTVSRNKKWQYYRCQNHQEGHADKCTMRKHVPAAKIEAKVWRTLQAVRDKELMRLRAEELFVWKEWEIVSTTTAQPDTKKLKEKLTDLDKRWVKFQRAYDADAISLSDLKARRTELEEERRHIERLLQKSGNHEEELSEFRRAKETLLKSLDRSDLFSNRGFRGNGVWRTTPPEERRGLYERYGVKVKVGRDCVPVIEGNFSPGDMRPESRVSLEKTLLGRDARSERLPRRCGRFRSRVLRRS